MLELDREGPPAIDGETDREAVRNACRAPPTSATIQTVAQRAGRAMADRKPATRGRKPPEGSKKQFLTSMDPDAIGRVKAAAAMRDKTASLVLEEAAKEWLDRHQDGKK